MLRRISIIPASVAAATMASAARHLPFHGASLRTYKSDGSSDSSANTPSDDFSCESGGIKPNAAMGGYSSGYGLKDMRGGKTMTTIGRKGSGTWEDNTQSTSASSAPYTYGRGSPKHHNSRSVPEDGASVQALKYRQPYVESADKQRGTKGFLQNMASNVGLTSQPKESSPLGAAEEEARMSGDDAAGFVDRGRAGVNGTLFTQTSGGYGAAASMKGTESKMRAKVEGKGFVEQSGAGGHNRRI